MAGGGGGGGWEARAPYSLSRLTSFVNCGWVQDDFLEVMLPVIGDSIRQAEQQGEGHADPAGGALDPSIAKALRRRQRGISSKKDLAEASTVFKVKATCVLCLLACLGQAVCAAELQELMLQVDKSKSSELQNESRVSFEFATLPEQQRNRFC